MGRVLPRVSCYFTGAGIENVNHESCSGPRSDTPAR
jgi:hypothetical protein